MEPKTNNLGLDLGLSALMSAVASEPSASISVVPEPIAIIISSVETVAPVRNEFETLADAEKWSALSSLCEERLAKSSGALEPRLWWISANMKTGAMPISLIAAPLDAATKDVNVEETDTAIKILAARTLVIAAALLEAARDQEFSISFLTRAYAFDKSEGLTLASSLDRELIRLSDHSGLSTKQKTERLERSKDLLQLRSTLPTVEVVERAVPAKTSVNAKYKSGASKASAIAHLEPRKTWWKQLTVAGACTALIVSILITDPLHFLTRLFSFAGGAPAFATSSTLEASEQRAPAPARIENVSAFDGLYYDLKSNGAVKAQPAETQSPQITQAQPMQEARAVSPKQPLDVAGPKEPLEIQEAMMRPEESPQDTNAQILFGGAGAVRASGSIKSSEHSIARNRAAQKFTSKEVYRVISRTKILSDPASTAGVLGLLEAGEHVSAESSIDQWLQIRSSSGRVGYILAQDAALE